MEDHGAALGGDSELVEETRELLGDVADFWQLSAAEWVEVEAILDAMSAAIAGRDAEGFRTAVANLEDFDPLRTSIPLGSDMSGAGERIRERLNELVHQLGPGDAGGGDARREEPDPAGDDVDPA